MKEFGNKLIILLFTAFFAACGQGVVIEVANPSGPDRDGELAELSLRELSGLPSGGFRLLDASGEEVAYQLTSDSLLVFPVRVRAGVTAVYRVVKGTPSRVDTVATGSFRPDRMGDIIWENDRCGWRTYGPPTRAVGQAAYGYDVFTKSISRPVMAARFDRDRDAQPEIRRLRAAGRNAAADSLARSVSYHVDHGDGMDVYPVGGSLGCGTAALLEEGRIVFPWTWASYEFLDNGPLRFRMKLTMEPFEYKGRMVTETRVVTCDAGSWLNRAEISYDGLDEAPLSVGIVVHATHPDAWRAGGGLHRLCGTGRSRSRVKRGDLLRGRPVPS